MTKLPSIGLIVVPQPLISMVSVPAGNTSVGARGEGILEYPDVGAEDANQDATRIPQGCR